MSENDESNVIRTFWHGPDLSVYEELALASFVKLGHRVQLFSYRELRPIPGVERVDAACILPEAEVFSYQEGPGRGSFAAFANWFRYKMLSELGGTWIDTDVLCLKPLSALPSPCVGWPDGATINSAIMRFPPGHFVTKELYDRAKKLGRSIQWGQAGPDLLTEVVWPYRDEVAIMPREAFYPLHWTDAWKIISAKESENCEALTSGSYCVHWWNEILRQLGLGKDTMPPVGSYLYRRACKILGENGFEAWPADEIQTRITEYLASRRLPQLSTGTWKQRLVNAGPFEFVSPSSRSPR